jgi:purine-binding chemotaxis protein CheW
MDLAKIRKKSLLTHEEHVAEPAAVSVPAPEPALSRSASFSVLPAAPVDDFFTQEPSLVPAVDIVAASPAITVPLSDHTAVVRPPLEAIMAGRSAAGCDDESSFADDTDVQAASESWLEFLCFRVSDEIYGINIMDIKEIIKPREVTEVPRAPAFVSGVLSLRGTIIPVIDMRIRLGLSRGEPTGKERIIVIKNNNSFSGLLVDEVIQVLQVQQDAVEAAPTVLDGIDRDFVSGIGRSDGRLMIILDLENIADIHLY